MHHSCLLLGSSSSHVDVEKKSAFNKEDWRKSRELNRTTEFIKLPAAHGALFS